MTDVDLTTAALPGASAHLRGYVARPAGQGPWPSVLVVHEAFGLDEMTRVQTDRLAAAGYLALAVDLFSDGGARRCLISTFRSVTSGRGRAYTDIASARAWLLEQPDSTDKVGIIGFCMGGGFALMSLQAGFDASAPNYGAVPKDLDRALQGGCPVVASYGGKDGTLKGAAATLADGLERAGVPHDVKEYPSAGHSFLNDRPVGPRVLQPLLRVGGVGPEPVAAADAWARIESFFGEHLH